jgi:hypothetical protein
MAQILPIRARNYYNVIFHLPGITIEQVNFALLLEQHWNVPHSNIL